MSKYVFMYKENNTDDRDCVKYIEIDRLGKLECGHYFPSINTHGACFCEGFEINKIDFDNITSILTKEDFEALTNYNKELKELKYGIEKGDERYNKGIELYNGIKHILNKLLSEENQELFEKVIVEEREYLMDEYNLSDEDIDKIFDEYYLDYRDRGTVGYIYDDVDDLAYEEAWSMGYVDSKRNNDRYFNYEKFGEDLLDSENYLELDDGRVVSLMY